MSAVDQTIRSFDEWVDNARRWLTSDNPHRRCVCVDAKGRRCRIGSDFMRARDEDAFPIRWYWPEQILGAGLECEVSDVLRLYAVPYEPPDFLDYTRDEPPDPLEEALTDYVLRTARETEASVTSR